jgi:hypothetical protein
MCSSKEEGVKEEGDKPAPPTDSSILKDTVKEVLSAIKDSTVEKASGVKGHMHRSFK